MNINNISTSTESVSTYSAYLSKSTESKKASEETGTTTTTTTSEEAAATYESSSSSETNSSTTQKTTSKYTQNTALINQMKQDLEQRQQQLTSIVEQMMGKQTSTYGKANSIWEFLASGDYTVDAETQAQAQADIAEDGYWGVDQTSSRILDFATALTGGDPDQIENMRDAFKEGFEQATKAWGKDLPDISSKTYDAVMKGFDELAKKAGIDLDSTDETDTSSDTATDNSSDEILT